MRNKLRINPLESSSLTRALPQDGDASPAASSARSRGDERLGATLMTTFTNAGERARVCPRPAGRAEPQNEAGQAAETTRSWMSHQGGGCSGDARPDATITGQTSDTDAQLLLCLTLFAGSIKMLCILIPRVRPQVT